MQVGIARDQAARALVGEDGVPDVAALEVGVAEIEVEVAALDAGGEDLLVGGDRVGVVLVAVEGVAAEEERLRRLVAGVCRRRDAGGDAAGAGAPRQRASRASGGPSRRSRSSARTMASA